MINDKHPFLSLSAEMASICNLLAPFGIHHFTYLKQYHDGKRISLSNKPGWIADYYNLNLYQSSLFENQGVKDITLFDTWFGDYDLDVYRHGKYYYNTMHSISIIECKKKYSEAFLFATTPDNYSAIHYLSNNREILFHFIFYLKDHGKNILKKAEKHGMIIPQITEVKNTVFPDEDARNEMESQKKLFFDKTPIHQLQMEDFTNEVVKLSQREIQCICHLLNHKTAIEMSVLMNISPRTVESYLDNIKLKLRCGSRVELIQKLKSWPHWQAIFHRGN